MYSNFTTGSNPNASGTWNPFINGNYSSRLIPVEREKISSISVEFTRNQREDEARLLKRVLQEERRIMHYSTSHKILIVGEGDFSFSACLARVFGSATNMVATSLDSKVFLMSNYKNAESNIDELRSRGCMVIHGVDAIEMKDYCWLKGRFFDRVIFNFPHVCFRTNESRESSLSRNQILVSGFFDNAKKLIREGGEIHITHKSMGFFLEWNLEASASSRGLRLIEEVQFRLSDYPGYENKYGYGGDKNFNCEPSKTYKFGLQYEKPTLQTRENHSNLFMGNFSEAFGLQREKPTLQIRENNRNLLMGNFSEGFGVRHEIPTLHSNGHHNNLLMGNFSEGFGLRHEMPTLQNRGIHNNLPRGNFSEGFVVRHEIPTLHSSGHHNNLLMGNFSEGFGVRHEIPKLHGSGHHNNLLMGNFSEGFGLRQEMPALQNRGIHNILLRGNCLEGFGLRREEPTLQNRGSQQNLFMGMV